MRVQRGVYSRVIALGASLPCRVRVCLFLCATFRADCRRSTIAALSPSRAQRAFESAKGVEYTKVRRGSGVVTPTDYGADWLQFVASSTQNALAGHVGRLGYKAALPVAVAAAIGTPCCQTLFPKLRESYVHEREKWWCLSL